MDYRFQEGEGQLSFNEYLLQVSPYLQPLPTMHETLQERDRSGRLFCLLTSSAVIGLKKSSLGDAVCTAHEVRGPGPGPGLLHWFFHSLIHSF